MTREEAIIRLEQIFDITNIPKTQMSLQMAIDDMREQEERESVWHDAKNSPPKKPGVYYGKVDETDSMYACQYRDGVWTMNSYPETKMPIIKWAFYDAFVREQEERENYESTTNADRIRSMNNYELAVFFAKTKAALYRADLPVIAYSTQDMKDNLEWLQEPAEGE